MKIKCFLIAAFALCMSAFAIPDMTLVSGDYKIVFDIGEKAKCSIVQIFYKDVELGTRTGWYGTVFCPASGKYIGAGHSEGGSEVVKETSMTVDGKPGVIQAGTVIGQEIVLHKVTNLANLQLEVTWRLTPEGLDISKQVEAKADQAFHSMYIFQKCWSNKSTDYILFKMNGTSREGKFPPPEPKPTQSNITWPIREAAGCYCISQYLADSKAAHLTFLADFSDAPGQNKVWNVKGYHKQYFELLLPKLIPAGFKSPLYKMIIRGFNAENQEEWKAKATALKDELLVKYPLFKNHLEPLSGTTITMPPSPGKQQIRKVTLNVQPDANYSISFQISKTQGVSKAIQHHYAFVGYYDAANKKYPQLAQLAKNVPLDGEFHKEQAVFHAPASGETVFLYLYNSHSDGTVVVKDIVLDKQK